MKDNGGGVIINNASIAAVNAGAGMIAYRSSKAAIAHATKCMAIDLAPYNIRVNCLTPAHIRTDINTMFDQSAIIRAMQPLQRQGTPRDVAEAMLYLVTLLCAPWLMRQGQHIRVDIILRAVPKPVGWAFEWIVDVLALGCCAAMAYYGARAALASYSAGSMSIKTLITPEWWLLSVLPLAFVALTLEMFFRMRRLYLAPRAPRDDAVSTG